MYKMHAAARGGVAPPVADPARAITSGAGRSSLDTGYPAVAHSHLLALVAAAPEPSQVLPRQLYRQLAWRYWLLALAAGAAIWWIAAAAIVWAITLA